MRQILEEEDSQERNEHEGNFSCIKQCFHIILMILISYIFYIIISFGALFIPVILAHSFFKQKIMNPKNKAVIIVITFISIPFSYIISILYFFIYIFICDIIQIIRNITRSNVKEKKRKEERNKINPIDESNEEKQNAEAVKKLLDYTDVSKHITGTKQDNFFHNKEAIIIVKE